MKSDIFTNLTGLATASRLAEDPRFEILVIEAGPDAQNNSIINDPEQYVYTVFLAISQGTTNTL